jgi:hypothetical protein
MCVLIKKDFEKIYSTLSSSTVKVEEPDLRFSQRLPLFLQNLYRVLFAIAYRKAASKDKDDKVL